MKKLRISCPYCHGVYTAEMEEILYASGNCDTCGPDAEGTITIRCTHCKRIVYKKEVSS